MDELRNKWDEIKESIKQDVGMYDASYNIWLRPLQILSLDNETCVIGAPNSIKSEGVDFIKEKYGIFFDLYIQNVTGKKYNLEFVLVNEDNEPVSSYIKEDSFSVPEVKKLSVDNQERAKKANLNPKYTFDNFIVGGSNNVAKSAAVAVTENPGTNFNPLFIWGNSGLGKTHLMHAIGHEIIKRNPNMNVLYVTSETFTNEVIESLKMGDQARAMAKFREKYRNIDLLLLDDVQFLEGKQRSQEEFFHTFNELHSSGKAIILSSDKPPKNLETLEERIRSRFEWGITVDIGAPDFETRVAILRKNAEVRNCNIDDEIIQYLASKIRSNIRELEGAFNKVVLIRNMNKKDPISIETVDEAIKDLITPEGAKKITPELIMEKVCSYYNISSDDVLSQKRNKEIAYPRQITMYLCKIMTNYNISTIGKFLGNRDHATVIYGCNKIEEDLKTNEELSDILDNIKKSIVN